MRRFVYIGSPHGGLKPGRVYEVHDQCVAGGSWRYYLSAWGASLGVWADAATVREPTHEEKVQMVFRDISRRYTTDWIPENARNYQGVVLEGETVVVLTYPWTPLVRFVENGVLVTSRIVAVSR